MTALCLRCDWVGDVEAGACPRCGAPLYHESAPPGPSARPRAELTVEPPGAPEPDGGPDAWSAPVRAPTSVRAAFAFAAVVTAALVVVLSLGREPSSPVDPPQPLLAGGGAGEAGILVYSVRDPSGAARLWLWPVGGRRVRMGPLIRTPVELVTVRTPAYGWVGFTSDLGNGLREASVLGSLDRDAEPEAIGTGQLIAWARGGGTAIFVHHGPVRDGCRRRVTVLAVSLDVEGREPVLDDTICGEVLSVGRTSIGYFLTRAGPEGADVVAAGYEDAGVLLRDHGLIGISPGGAMLVTPSSELRAPGAGGSTVVAGAASLFDQFGGRPQPYLVRGEALRVEDVLAYAPGSTTALVTGRLPGQDPGIWELPLGAPGNGPERPRFVAATEGRTEATYAGDGTAYVMTRGSLWVLRDHRLEPLGLPTGAPRPNGPLVWIVREPLIGL